MKRGLIFLLLGLFVGSILFLGYNHFSKSHVVNFHRENDINLKPSTQPENSSHPTLEQNLPQTTEVVTLEGRPGVNPEFIQEFQTAAAGLEKPFSGLTPSPPYGRILTEPEQQWMISQIRIAGLPMRERIFAALRLADHPTAHANGIRSLLVKGREVAAADAAPHSEQEMKRQQEGTLRIMLIDALVESAITNPKVRQQLRDLEPLLVEEAERTYLRQRMSELSL